MNENNTVVTKIQKNDKKSDKKKGKFNFIDFLLILIAALLVVAIVYVFLPSSWIKGMFADKSVDIEYSIEIIGVDQEFIDSLDKYIKENDIVIDGVSKANIGTVKAVTDITPYTELKYQYTGVGKVEYVDKEDKPHELDVIVPTEGKGVLSTVEGKYNIIVTITAKADFTEGDGYSVNGTRIAVGEKINARFPNYVCEGYCISVPVN
jgi:hypothetical protein